MKKHILTTLLFIGSSLSLFSQREISPSDSFVIFGKVKKATTIKIKDLTTFTSVKIPQQIIYNHKGEIKDTIQNLEGIPLESILLNTEYIYTKPKELNEFYFVFKATDGYRWCFHGMKFTTPNLTFISLPKSMGNPLQNQKTESYLYPLPIKNQEEGISKHCQVSK